jgi:uncharacterized protein with HEPN domain
MLLSHLEFLRHILDEVNFILVQAKGKNQQELLNDQVLQRAVIRSLEIIGEASKKIAPDFRVKYPQVDWKKMAGTRDKLIHHYFGVDYDIVWDIISNELPNLQTEIGRIIKSEEK